MSFFCVENRVRLFLLFFQEDVSWTGRELGRLSITILIAATVSGIIAVGCGVYYQRTCSTSAAHPPSTVESQEADAIPLQTSILPQVKTEVEDDELEEIICEA